MRRKIWTQKFETGSSPLKIKGCIFWSMTPSVLLKINRPPSLTLRSKVIGKDGDISITRELSLPIGLFFCHEDGRDMFFRNVGCLSTNYTALHFMR
jgi:hypothetical protein